jgi:hypothetical protein
VEYFTLISDIMPHTLLEECVVVQSFTPNDTTVAPGLAVLGLAFILDCLLANGCENLSEACTCPPWLVEQDDLYDWYSCYSPPRPKVNATLWNLPKQSGYAQSYMTGLVIGMNLL